MASRAFDREMSRTGVIRPRRFGRWRANTGVLGDWAAFLIPISGAFLVNVGGMLPYAEILFLLSFPFLILKRGKRIFDREYRTAYLLMGLWAFSQALTDIFVDAAPANRIKGLARVAFFALDLACVAAIIGTSLRRTKIFSIGMILSLSYSSRAGGGDMALMWKMWLAPAASMAVFLFASPLYVKRRYYAVLLLAVALAAVNLHYAVRGAMVIDLAVGVLLLPIFPQANSGSPSFLRSGPGRVVILLGLSMVAVWASQQVLRMAANAGLFSENDQAKFEQQSQGKLGIIFGGRPEGLVAARAIMDSPILGHGSYAVDYKYYELLQEYRYRFGYAEGDDAEDVEEPGIPTHSHLTMSWVEGGFLASLFWFYMLMLIARCIIRLTETPHPLGPFYMYLLISLTWDILFSPFGLTRRMWEAFLLLIMINLLRSKPAQRGRTDMRVEQKRLGFRPAAMWRPARSFGQTLGS